MSPPAPVRSEAPASRAGAPRLLDVVTDALEDVERLRLPLDLAGAADARALRDRVAVQLRTHLLPRLRGLDHPAIVVLGGSTGAGKSTIVNSIVGAEVTEAGVLRPTTRLPVLVVHPDDVPSIAQHPVTDVVAVVAHGAVPPGIALLDTPDLDSIDDENRSLGAQLIEAADLWVFVTTAARYGDAVPWRTLEAARDRGVTLTVVLNRVTSGAIQEVRADLMTRLIAHDLGSVPLFVLPDVGPHEGLLPHRHVAEIAYWLDLLARQTRSGVVARTIRASWPSLRGELTALADAADEQAAAAQALFRLAESAVEPDVAAAVGEIEAGSAGHGGPTTHWLALASTGGPLTPLVGGRRVRAHGRAMRTRAVLGLELAAADAVAAIASDAAARAERNIREAWSESGPGGAHLAEKVDVAASHLARTDRIAANLAGWADGVAGEVATWLPDLPPRAGHGLEPRGWSALVCTAATGVDGASRAVDSLLGPRGREAREAAREDLAARVAEIVRAEARAFTGLVGVVSVDEERGTGLRVRASELRGLA